jgi:hypothetical protein
MMRTCIGLVFLTSVAILPARAEDKVAFDAGGLRIALGDAGRVQSLLDARRPQAYLAAKQPAAILTLTMPGKTLLPVAMDYDRAGQRMKLGYEGGATAVVKVAVKPTHLTLELESVQGAAPIRVDWGPLPTTIGKTIGETVGVVRDDQFALGIQSLNIQTVGLAAARPFGSILHAYAVEHDGGVRGSKIALFGCPASEALATIGKIEVAEGLPHPMLDGVWGKMSPTARVSYLITPFGEPSIDEVCQYARKAALTYVYHPGPFATWGHFVLHRGEFPGGDASMKRCVEKAAAQGIRLGVHTLTGFITPNDSYVTPVPDPRLARSGTSTLAAAVDEKATEIVVADPEPFRKRVAWDKPMNTVIVGRELVRYQSVSETQPWKLIGCTRGAFGTKAAAHAAGAEAGRLADHAYNTFYPGIENGMMDEMTRRLVELFNTTGLRQISFDGLEGLSAYGYGEYARNRFVRQCYDGWNHEVISDASNLLHYLWHVHTRMNWGEPWGKAMREGMAEYRFQNQAYFERNLFPRMLGWFEVRAASPDLEATTLDDMEWMLAKAAGYDAGFAVSTSLPALRDNAQTPAILDAVKNWEALRLASRFSPRQREALRGRGEFHLERTDAGAWQLRPVAFSRSMTCDPKPGQPADAAWEIENRFAAQPLRLVLRAVPSGKAAAGSRIANPSFEVAGRRCTFAVELKPHEYLVVSGDRQAAVCDANWKELRRVRADAQPPELPSGKHVVRFHCMPAGDAALQVRARFQTLGSPEPAGK